MLSSDSSAASAATHCRLCHDEASDHRLDRYAVSEMACMLCGTRQPVGGSCANCGESMAGYYCGICHLFDNEPGRDIYHCPFCNVCRWAACLLCAGWDVAL
jgi:zinc finger-like protein